MTKDEALKLAMEAMEITGGFDVEINAIKEALAQPEPWEKFCDSNCVWTDHHPDCKLAERKPLTDEEVNKLVDDEDWYNDPYGFVRAIEAALRSKNT